VAQPFLVSPYAGWSEVASFVDHDQPDYSVDGKVVLANGLTAVSADGLASDSFPAYWSPALRQYVNYDGHNGYDFAISYQPVLAAAAGIVEFAGWNVADTAAGYGQMVIIDHRNGYATLYGHLSKLEVRKGDRVRAGKEIAISGTTGNSTGPHLHFSVFHNCRVTDPYGWTGRGRDPLEAFNGERPTYLWQPGHDPLLLNPPPNWPAYPSDLSLSQLGTAGFVGSGLRLPPTDRLLLLSLPGPSAVSKASPALALARTEEAVREEARSLTYVLRDLRRIGLVSSYQALPAAAAIWIRGSASAGQLEALPGVASLSGVEPRDLEAAEAGLSHAVLIEIGSQQAPSLWPAGFHSSLQPWRPVATVVQNSALLAGFTLPGQAVDIVLERARFVVARASAVADASSGGFVATLRDPAGSSVTPVPGDIVTVTSAGRTTRMSVLNISLQTRPRQSWGQAPASTGISLTYAQGAGSVDAAPSISTGGGSFRAWAPDDMRAGTLGVATVSDASGNVEAAYSAAPGIQITEGTGLVNGWTLSRSPKLTVTRHGRFLFRRLLHVAHGYFQTDLAINATHFEFLPGDVVTLDSGSGGESRRVALPVLTLGWAAGSLVARARASPSSQFSADFSPPVGPIWSRVDTVGAVGLATITIPVRRVTSRQAYVLSCLLPFGDIVRSTFEYPEVVLHVGSSRLTGTAHPGNLIRIEAMAKDGRYLGGGVAMTAPNTGAFQAKLFDWSGRSPNWPDVSDLKIQTAFTTATIQPRVLSLRFNPATSSVGGHAPSGSSVWLTEKYSGRTTRAQKLVSGRDGRYLLRLSSTQAQRLETTTATMSLGKRAFAVRRIVLATDRLGCGRAIRPRSTPSTSRGCKGNHR
jgi:ribosomal 50S subunit-recycling heat shock protein